MPTFVLKHMEIAAKLRRAREHLEALKGEVQTFLDSDPYEIITEFDSESLTKTFSVKASKPFPIPARLLVGEILGQLRSSLDHMIWHISSFNKDVPPGSKTEFPIFYEREEYAKFAPRKIRSLSDGTRAYIERLQPYWRTKPEEHPLWVLHRLTNDDKHRLPHIIHYSPAGGGSVDFAGVPFHEASWIETPFSDQAVVFVVRLKRASDADVEMQVKPKLWPIFGIGSVAEGSSLIDGLEIIGRTVATILYQLQDAR